MYHKVNVETVLSFKFHQLGEEKMKNKKRLNSVSDLVFFLILKNQVWTRICW